MEVNFYDGGYCTHVERTVISNGRFCNTKFPSMFVHFHHEKHGHILYDTGYSDEFHNETKSFPNKLYAMVTPVFVKEEDTAVYKLKQNGINPDDVRYIIISHFHADHIAALKDFPKAKFIYFNKGFTKFDGMASLKRLTNGYLAGLIPENFLERTIIVEEKPKTLSINLSLNQIFETQYDIFGDGSLLAIELPGHARGQLGLFFNNAGQDYFLVADSCWMSEAYEKELHPLLLSYLIADSAKSYNQTLSNIHELNKSDNKIMIVPSHCGKKFLDLVKNPTYSTGLNGVTL